MQGPLRLKAWPLACNVTVATRFKLSTKSRVLMWPFTSDERKVSGVTHSSGPFSHRPFHLQSLFNGKRKRFFPSQWKQTPTVFYSRFNGDTITGNWTWRGGGSEETNVIYITTFSPVNTWDVPRLFVWGFFFLTAFPIPKAFKGAKKKSFNQKILDLAAHWGEHTLL